MDIITLAAAKAAAKQYTDAQIATINSVGFHICTSAEYDSSTGLPIIQNPDETTFYLVPSGDSGNNIFDEYFYTNNQWELFGSGYLDVSLPENFAAEYDSTATYAVGSYAMHDGVLYKCTTAIASAEAWTAAHWTATSVGNELAGYVKDVQVDGTSVVNNGVANIPAAASNVLGVTRYASASEIKTGTTTTRTIIPAHQHTATFYGLATAAGDSTQASSDNAVGTYTAAAKSAIQTMLGVDGCAMVSVSGATPVITGEANTRYMCGTVTSISITPPSSGIIDVIFTSGSTAATLTLPSTVKMPDWFGGVEPNTVYEINIAEGVYGSVMTWEA